MIPQSLFATTVYHKTCNIDLKRLEDKCLSHSKEVKTAALSNVGGYQGHDFYDEELFLEISNSLPTIENKFISSITTFAWVNVNSCGDYNERHNHDPWAGTFMSGIFYVRTPPNSGRIRFYDPRPNILMRTKDMLYYNGGNNYHYYDPEENFMLIFPPWLEHQVELNKSNEKRISISFNILVNNE
jgi:uncharacterized protein (TIGR02466 family)